MSSYLQNLTRQDPTDTEGPYQSLPDSSHLILGYYCILVLLYSIMLRSYVFRADVAAHPSTICLKGYALCSLGEGRRMGLERRRTVLLHYSPFVCSQAALSG